MSRLFEIKGELEALLAQAIDVETGEIKDEAALALFEQAEGALEAQALATAIVVRELEAEAEKIAAAQKRLAERVAQLRGAASEREDWLRIVLPVGFKAKDERVALAIGKPSMRVEIEDEAMVPEVYCEVVWTPRKDAIRADLLKGIEITGAVLVPGQKSVTIK